mmetsp:Transcript_22230/g.58005  ORF Transcript_22230/g.58005 Transcript_22230/m.58005 type:complete len:214 (+) Transcript_22230:45-686(+)
MKASKDGSATSSPASTRESWGNIEVDARVMRGQLYTLCCRKSVRCGGAPGGGLSKGLTRTQVTLQPRVGTLLTEGKELAMLWLVKRKEGSRHHGYRGQRDLCERRRADPILAPAEVFRQRQREHRDRVRDIGHQLPDPTVDCERPAVRPNKPAVNVPWDVTRRNNALNQVLLRLELRHNERSWLGPYPGDDNTNPVCAHFVAVIGDELVKGAP